MIIGITLTKHIILYLYIQSLFLELEDREARLRAQEEEMKVRDAEINRLLGELRQLQRQQVRTVTKSNGCPA